MRGTERRIGHEFILERLYFRPAFATCTSMLINNALDFHLENENACDVTSEFNRAPHKIRNSFSSFLTRHNYEYTRIYERLSVAAHSLAAAA